MEPAVSSLPPWMSTLKEVASFASAIFGMLGTWLMSRRYARELFRSLLYSAAWPILFLLGQGKRVSGFLAAKTRLNSDVEDPPSTMVLGLNLLFWAFFLQLVVFFIERKR